MRMRRKLINRFINLSYQIFEHAIIKELSHKWAYVSYITGPFNRKNNKKYLSGHQNRQEALEIAKVLEELNYSFVITEFNKDTKKIDRNYDLVFGLEPNFLKACASNKDAIKIYYATGAYYKHQNKMIISRTDEFNKKYGTNFPYERLVAPHESSDIADHIIQIGSQITVDTYPANLKRKIVLINQSSHKYDEINILDKINRISRNDFVWFGGGGSILKGLDLVIEYFLNNPKLNLHIIGHVPKIFISVFSKALNRRNNIKFYGFLDINSKYFRDIIDKCTFLIFPSASEAGCPGSVINLQKLGVIPIVSKWASPDNINELGFQLKDLTVEGIKDAIDWCQNVSHNRIKQLIIQNHDYILLNHDLEKFKDEFKRSLSSFINI